ncbi:MAG: recombination protein RecR [Kofleriaceae bacterium]|nr:recombination protein RecR [Kofleriaceae bacterium]
MSNPIDRLVQCLSRLPGIGEKTATRLAFHLVRASDEEARDLASALIEVTEEIRLCSVCANLTQADPCHTCSDVRRDSGLICVVSSPSDVVAIDKSGDFRGTFHVLHGLLSPLDGIGPNDLRIAELVRRLQFDSDGESLVQEVIIATNASVEGEATAMYMARMIKPLGVKVTRIASGIPVGGELEYTDRATIARAMSGRLPL